MLGIKAWFHIIALCFCFQALFYSTSFQLFIFFFVPSFFFTAFRTRFFCFPTLPVPHVFLVFFLFIILSQLLSVFVLSPLYTLYVFLCSFHVFGCRGNRKFAAHLNTLLTRHVTGERDRDKTGFLRFPFVIVPCVSQVRTSLFSY